MTIRIGMGIDRLVGTAWSVSRISSFDELAECSTSGHKGVTEPRPFKYRAFLSYSHRDAVWGKWLHASLERYRIEKDLIGRMSPVGAVPKTLRPIFRDREDFSAGHSLRAQTRAALEASQFLVVVCSPNAAKSQYVNEEIRRYKASGRSAYVIPIIVDGEPGDPERECFPFALRFKIGPDGTPTDEREEPIAADARPQGDGKDVAKLKVVAGLLGVGLDEILRRAERALDAGIRTSNSLTQGLAIRFRNRMGIPSELTKYILSQTLLLHEKLTGFGRSTPDLLRSEAVALRETSETLLTIGDTTGALAAAVRARQIYENLLASKPNDPVIQQNVAVNYETVGNVLLAQGEREEALAAYRKALAIAQKIVDRNSGDANAQEGLAIDYVHIGDALNAGLQYDGALAAYQTSLAIRERLVHQKIGSAEWQRGLGISYERIGQALLAQGKPEEALAAYQKRLAIAQGLADHNRADTELQRELAIANNKIGDVLLALSKPDEAFNAYWKGLSIRQNLAESDQGNALWQRDVAVSHNYIGDIMMAQGKPEEALGAYQRGLAIEQKLAANDLHNVTWQRDLFVSYTRIGRMLQIEGKLEAALKVSRDALGIAERLSKAHPGDEEWQRALEFGIAQIGLLAYRFVTVREFALGLEVAEQSISLSRDTIWLYSNRAHALMFLDRTDEARALYLRYRGRTNIWHQDSWEDFIRREFAELRREGLARPLMDEIENRFADGK